MSIDKNKLFNTQFQGTMATEKPPPEDAYMDEDEIDGLLEQASEKFHGKSTFVESLIEWREKKGFLTDSQYRALRKIIYGD